MNKEHLFPQWLIKRSKITLGISWAGKKGVNPFSATIPLCVDCNSEFGTSLESPVAHIFAELESGSGISDRDAELLVRWLWKFEGLGWCTQHPEHHYSTVFTLRDRVLGGGFDRIRPHLVLAVGLVEEVPDSKDLPLGLDSPIGGLNAIFVSGVFSRVAMMVVLDQFLGFVPSSFGTYAFGNPMDDRDAKVFFPEVKFPSGRDAIDETFTASVVLDQKHEQFARMASNDEKKLPIFRPNRVELPPSVRSDSPMFSDQTGNGRLIVPRR